MRAQLDHCLDVVRRQPEIGIARLGTLDAAGRYKIATRIMAGWLKYVDRLCELGADDTPAQFQERCSRAALALHYGDEQALDQLRTASASQREITFFRAPFPASDETPAML